MSNGVEASGSLSLLHNRTRDMIFCIDGKETKKNLYVIMKVAQQFHKTFSCKRALNRM
jgi:hypothetical protein